MREGSREKDEDPGRGMKIQGEGRQETVAANSCSKDLGGEKEEDRGVGG